LCKKKNKQTWNISFVSIKRKGTHLWSSREVEDGWRKIEFAERGVLKNFENIIFFYDIKESQYTRIESLLETESTCTREYVLENVPKRGYSSPPPTNKSYNRVKIIV